MGIDGHEPYLPAFVPTEPDPQVGEIRAAEFLRDRPLAYFQHSFRRDHDQVFEGRPADDERFLAFGERLPNQGLAPAEGSDRVR